MSPPTSLKGQLGSLQKDMESARRNHAMHLLMGTLGKWLHQQTTAAFSTWLLAVGKHRKIEVRA